MNAVLATLLLALVFAGSETQYKVDTSKKNVVKFISEAPLENFEGVTENIDGYLLHASDSLTEKSEVYFAVDLRTLDTGIGLRNRHMREDYLETDKYPLAKFKGRIVKATPQGQSVSVTVDGRMFIHGVTQPLTVQGRLIPEKNGYRVQATSTVKLSDYKIPIPQLMFMKINESIRLSLDFHLST
jgi:polyisoprenoid-binding protein YceI